MDQRPQRGALHQHGEQDDREGRDQDRVAAGELHRQRQGGRQGHDSAHAGPADDQRHSGGGGRLLRPPPRRQDRPEIHGGEHPDQAGDHAGRRDGERQGQLRRERPELAPGPRQHAAQRQPDQHEDQGLQHEHHEFPHRHGVAPDMGIEGLVLPPAQHQPAGHDGEHPGGVDLLGGEIGGVGGQETQHRDGVGVVQAPDQRVHRQAGDQPDRDPRRRQPGEAARRRPGAEAAGQRRRHGEAVEHEARGVVDEALALQDRDHPAGQGDPGQHRLGGDRVGGRHDGAQREAGRPGQDRRRRVGDEPDRQGGEQDRAQRQGQDRAEACPEVAPDGEVGRFEQERRQEQDHDQVRIEIEGRQARRHSQHHAAQHQGGGRRESETPGHQGQQQGRPEEREDQLEQGDGRHRSISALRLR